MSHIHQLGERRVIEIIMEYLEEMPEMPIPFWDDVSAVDLGGGRLAILKTDMLVWSTDIPPGMTHYQAGRKAVVMNISDLAAKGVRPLAVLVSLGLPRDLQGEEVAEIARGMNDGAREYGAYVLGGDTNEAGEVIISGMAFGIAEGKKIMRRDGARPGDILATTGAFGKTAAGLKILLEGLEAPADLRSSLVEAVFMPRARVEEGVALAESGVVTASMDSSDGLALSLYDLSRSSGVGFRVDRLPAAPEARRFAELHGLELSDLVLYGGEEYELVFTVKPEGVEEARRVLRRVGRELIVIGEVTEEKEILYRVNGELRPIRPGGWEHFKGGT
ncbi:thiamine-phosphate kinase [Candidatus Bathyarchaeota archaeon]|nr:thiamine-phosphate kinase [Candidatus Bathyarchaeota archaeon]